MEIMGKEDVEEGCVFISAVWMRGREVCEQEVELAVNAGFTIVTCIFLSLFISSSHFIL
jgi:hypothetical protein